MPDKNERSKPIAAATRIATTWPCMRYGELENLLVSLTGGTRQSVAGRFRNLRQVPFPDAIRTGTGNRVEYDLPRVLALCTAYKLNALLIPQANALAITRAIWPELVRGFIAGAVDAGLTTRPRDMPADLSATVSISIDGFGPAGLPAATASNLPREPSKATAAGPVAEVRVDFKVLIALLAKGLIHKDSSAEEADRAFSDLEGVFGWTRGSIPHRATAADMFAGSSFLDAGPFIGRADAYLRIAAMLKTQVEEGAPDRTQSRQAAQQLLDYLGTPSPIDAWKAEIGTLDGKLRLKHLLAAVGEQVGLSAVRYPETELVAAGENPAEQARALVEEAARQESEKRRSPA